MRRVETQNTIDQSLTPDQIREIRSEGGIEDIVVQGNEFIPPRPEDLDLLFFKDFGIHPHELRAYAEQVYRIIESPFFRDSFQNDHVARNMWIEKMSQRYGSRAMHYLKDQRLTISKMSAFIVMFDTILYRAEKEGYTIKTDDRLATLDGFRHRLAFLYHDYSSQPYEEKIRHVIDATLVGVEFLKMLEK
jgi:hypothetical protein